MAVELSEHHKADHHIGKFHLPDLEAHHQPTGNGTNPDPITTSPTPQQADAVPVAEGGDPLWNPFAVDQLPITNRVDFRFKLLALTTLNSVGILLVAILFATPGPLKRWIMKDQWYFNFVALTCFLLTMSSLTFAKERYPFNYIALCLFTISAGAFFGISSPGWGNNGNWQILSYMCSNLALFTFFATRTTPMSCMTREATPDSPQVIFTCTCALALVGMDDESAGLPALEPPKHVKGGRRIIFTLAAAAAWAWFATFAISLGLLIKWGYSEPGAFIGIHIFMFLVSWYFAYDTQIIEEHFSADQYMQGVVSFWADMIICIFCCICTSMFMAR
mmetsp:Transcript_74111/g.149325  ORF Transcript_74111/g.149325 Transcript_74111/m.149325 type:complete len:333 (+) Transcript_74111:75-1073(+)